MGCGEWAGLVLAMPRHVTASLQVAFRLDFEFSKSIFLHHLEIELAAGRSGPCLLLLPQACYSGAQFSGC